MALFGRATSVAGKMSTSSWKLSALSLPLLMAACHPTMPNPTSAEMRTEAAKLSPVDYASQTIDTLERGVGATVKELHSDAETRELEGRYRHSVKDQPLVIWMRNYCTAIGGQTVESLGSYCIKNDHVAFVLYSRVEQADGVIPIWSYRIVEPIQGVSQRLESQLIDDTSAVKKGREVESATQQALQAQEDAQKQARREAEAQKRRQELDAAHAVMDRLPRGAQVCSKPGLFSRQYVGNIEGRSADKLHILIVRTGSGFYDTGEPQPQQVWWYDVDLWQPC